MSSSDFRPLEDWSHSEWIAASRMSKNFFLRSFYLIPSVDPARPGLVPFALRTYQSDILDMIDSQKRIVGLKARQIGWTTVAVANALHDALFNEWRPWLFVSRNEDAAQDMVGKATLAYYRLPKWMRQSLPALTSDTKGTMIFENGSKIQAVPATASTGRGDAVYGTLLDECAFMEYAEEIWGAVEPLTYGPAMMFSTANGMGNFFHDMWLESQREGSVWKGMFYPWSEAPQRDQEWYESKKREHRVRPWFFYQEYPSTPEEAFSKSGRVAFAQDAVMEVFEEIEPEERFEYHLHGEVTPLAPGQEADIEINIWRQPIVREDEEGRLITKPNYAIGVDVAEGLEHGDFTYISVFDVVNNEQVATVKTHIPVYYLTSLAEWLGYYYHTGLLAIERNNHGIHPLEVLANERFYPRLYRMDRFAEMKTDTDRTVRYGWLTNKASKSKMVLDFQNAIQTGNVIIHDPEFLLEAQTFVADGKGSYGASSGNHDDVIMGTLIAWQAVLDSFLYHIEWKDTKVRPLTYEDMENFFFDESKNKPPNPLDSFLGQPERENVKKGLLIIK